MNTTSQIQSAAIQLKVSTGIAPNDAPFSGQTLALDPDNVTMVEAKSYQHFRLEQNGQVIENPTLDERGDDLIVTAPDGSTLVLLGFVPLAASGASSFVQDSRDLEEQGSDDIDDRQIPKEALAQTQAEAEPATDGEQTGDNSQAMDAVAANSDSTAQALNDLSESSMPEEEAEKDDDDFGILFWAGAGLLGSAGVASFLADDEGSGFNGINYNITANLGPLLVGTDLVVYLYKADGSPLSDGPIPFNTETHSYTYVDETGYTGMVIARLLDEHDEVPDYLD